MTIKKGIVVSHSGAVQWGVGKVVDVNSCRATIQFCDGNVRKIASSHYSSLMPADAKLYVPFVPPAAAKPRPAAKKLKKQTPV